jgi:hypothetical protein
MPIEVKGRVSELSGAERDTLRAAASILDRLDKTLDGAVLFDDGQTYFGMDDAAEKLREMAGQ